MGGQNSEQFAPDQERLIHAPWEKRFDRILTPFEEFVKEETTSACC